MKLPNYIPGLTMIAMSLGIVVLFVTLAPMIASPIVAAPLNLTMQCPDGCNLGGPIPTSGLLRICGILVAIIVLSMILSYLMKDIPKEEEKNEEPPCPPPSQ